MVKKTAFELEPSLTYQLHTLNKLTDRVSHAAYLQEVGLPISEGRCLAAIGSFHPLSVNDLAQRANLNKGQASRAAQSLVDQGLVSKQTSAQDARGVVLSLTEQGERTWRKAMALIERRNAQIMQGLTVLEQKQLMNLLHRLVERARLSVEDHEENN
jgi:DNA-binding MarR family transcriptional regulator